MNGRYEINNSLLLTIILWSNTKMLLQLGESSQDYYNMWLVSSGDNFHDAGTSSLIKMYIIYRIVYK